MELLYTPNSPYARIAQVCALRHGIDVGLLLVAVRDVASVILEYTPLAKVPALKLDDGRVLTETRLICEYFDHISQGGFTARVGEIDRRCLEGLVSGFLDGVAVWVREARREPAEQSPGILRLEGERARRCFEHFERHWNMASVEINFASVALASAIDLVDARLQTEWRSTCPELQRWFDRISENRSLRATAPTLA